MKIDGIKISKEITSKLKKLPTPKKFLAVVIVGSDSQSFGFVSKKREVAESLGVDFRIYNLPGDTNNDKARKEVLKIAKHKTCGGVLVQLPLPKHLSKHYVVNVIPREKDVDVLGERALGAFYAGRNPVLPPAVGVFEEIIKKEKVDIKNKRVAVVGPGFLVGRPVAVWLAGKVKELLVLDKGSDFSLLKNCDVVISGAGDPGVIKPEMLKDSALVVDFGYGKKGGKTTGDFDVLGLSVKNRESKIVHTPTPGGTGPILIAKLFENFYKLNEV